MHNMGLCCQLFNWGCQTVSTLPQNMLFPPLPSLPLNWCQQLLKYHLGSCMHGVYFKASLQCTDIGKYIQPAMTDMSTMSSFFVAMSQFQGHGSLWPKLWFRLTNFSTVHHAAGRWASFPCYLKMATANCSRESSLIHREQMLASIWHHRRQGRTELDTEPCQCRLHLFLLSKLFCCTAL